MINTDDFVKRLEIIFDYYGLTASSFADKISVQRSSISHLLSGRNKPSLDFILKVLECFPEVELLWLLNGKGNFPNDENYKQDETNVTTTSILSFNNEEKNTPDLFSTTNNDEKTAVIEDDLKNISNTPIFKTSLNELNQNSDIESIVVFFKDGTFKNYVQKNPNLK
ncbi:helix-turn-helix domain-containing protein [Flavobacterium difficile]|uniref:Helix-turn-helix transcriptional regulator n=1 Tax=Flavobacterium difficile TaxID=2709659 RepID=A0ABX0I484_9FLAO|nr:helix-turn-helix transcriptional regulator [Flavobacterium difficile]NHM02003.1 helix-turn-helix transcriptional regulator [Flavobacterium difficile]